MNRRSRYRRFELAGGTFFLTLLTMDRRPILRSRLALECLWSAYRYARGRRPFRLLGWVVLPDHLHVLVELPPRDDDFSTRMSQLKKRFTKRWLAAGGGERGQSLSRRRQGYRGIWQKRFWQHTCRFEEDVARCLDYIHWNPLKHGYVVQVRDWKASSFRRWARRGWYSNDWGGLTKEQEAGPFGERTIKQDGLPVLRNLQWRERHTVGRIATVDAGRVKQERIALTRQQLRASLHPCASALAGEYAFASATQLSPVPPGRQRPSTPTIFAIGVDGQFNATLAATMHGASTPRNQFLPLLITRPSCQGS